MLKKYKNIKKFNIKNAYVTMHGRWKNFYVEWYIGNLCNQRCSYCLNNDTYSQYYRDMTKEETDKVVNFINSLPEVCRIDIIGGEPSCFEHLFYAIENIKHNCTFNVLSNGRDEEFTEKFLSLSTQKRPMLDCITTHSEEYLREGKEKYFKHIDRLIELHHKYKHGEIEFNFLLDKEKTKEYKELIDYLYYKGYKENKINLVTSFVRRTRDAKETIKNFSITEIFDDEVKTYMQKDLLGERTNFLKHNEYCGEYCPIFTNYMYIRLDGKLDATSCEQEIITNKSIFDDDFDFEEEKRLLKQKCHCKRKPNNGVCGHVHGNHFEE